MRQNMKDQGYEFIQPGEDGPGNNAWQRAQALLKEVRQNELGP